MKSHFEIEFYQLKVIICRLFDLKKFLHNRLFYEKTDYILQPSSKFISNISLMFHFEACKDNIMRNLSTYNSYLSLPLGLFIIIIFF
jgi:hypothetical protein